MQKRTVGLVVLGAVVLIAGGAYAGMRSMGGMHNAMSNLMGEKMIHNVIGTPM